jgi:hypothetical protein
MDRWDTGRWAGQEWADRKAVFLNRGGATPSLLVVGDSTASTGFAPAELARDGFNLGRSGLKGFELPVLTAKLEALGIQAPATILVCMIQDAFRDQGSDRAFLETQGRRPWDLVSRYYSQPNLSQEYLLPGTRVAKFLAGSLLSRLDKRDETWRIMPDGLLAYDEAKSPAGPFLMLDNLLAEPGWMTPAHLAPLEAFHRHWSAKGCRLVFVHTPVHPVYLARFRERFPWDVALFRREVERIFRGQVVDLQEALPADALRDVIHLNDGGARRFSRLLRDRLDPSAPGASRGPVTP